MDRVERLIIHRLDKFQQAQLQSVLSSSSLDRMLALDLLPVVIVNRPLHLLLFPELSLSPGRETAVVLDIFNEEIVQFVVVGSCDNRWVVDSADLVV